MAVKALLRIKLVITPMRAEDTVISSRTRRIWTDERNTRPQSLACHRRKCDLRAQLPHHLRRRCDAGCQAAMRTRVAFSPMQWGVWRTRITLIGPDPSCPAADDCVFGALGVMTSEKRSRALSAIVRAKKRRRGVRAVPLCGETGPTCETATVTFFDGEHLGVR